MIDAACQPGWRSFHDLGVPGGRVRIQHLVVAPAGVFVVGCASWPGTVRLHRATLWAGGRPRSGEVACMHQEAEVVSALLAFETGQLVPVTAVLGLVDGRPVPPLVSADGVVAVAMDMLAWLLASRPPLLTEGIIEEVATAVLRRFRVGGWAPPATDYQ